MGSLNPFFLAAAAFAAVPLLLHLFQRQQASRLSFPALRYLQRTERDHARTIRFRQLLLLLLRVAAVAVVVGAGARLHTRGEGRAHPPTALAIILDNSASSGLVVGEERVLDRLRDLALGTLDAATEDDRIWVIRAGEPWLPAVPGGAREARRWVEEARPTAAGGDLSSALERARELVSSSGRATTEIHLLSDLQASAFTHGGGAPAGDVPVVVWASDKVPPPNGALTGLEVGGGLPPLVGQRGQVSVSLAHGQSGDASPVPVRLVVDGRVRGAGEALPGGTVTLPLAPAPPGWVTGYAETDPDALRADDRRYFAFVARPAPRVALGGDGGVFLTEALAVLQAGGRIRPGDASAAEMVLAPSGAGLEGGGRGSAVVVIPDPDPTLLPSLNRRLQETGIPWRLERRDGWGEGAMEGPHLPPPLEGARGVQWHRLVRTGEATAGERVLASVSGDPWAVEGVDRSGRRYLVLASALDAGSTSLPLSAGLLRFTDWLAVEWATPGVSASEALAGLPLSAPRGAEAVRLPSGVEVPLDGTRMVRATGEAGIYTFLADDTTLVQVALNPPPSESDLTPLPRARIGEAVGSRVHLVDAAEGWSDQIFRSRRGPELGPLLLVIALALLLVEAGVAATGRWTSPMARPSPSLEERHDVA